MWHLNAAQRRTSRNSKVDQLGLTVAQTHVVPEMAQGDDDV